jgi:hypothetical protein
MLGGVGDIMCSFMCWKNTAFFVRFHYKSHPHAMILLAFVAAGCNKGQLLLISYPLPDDTS